MTARSFTLWHRVLAGTRTVGRVTVLSFWRGLVGFFQSDNLTFASSIAYFALMSLFPLLLLALSLLGSATASDTARAAVLDFVLQYFPRQFEFVTTQLDAFRQSRVHLGVAGSLLMMWAALGVFGAIASAVNHAWGVERGPGFLKHKLVSFLMMVAAAVLMLLAVVLVSVQGVVETSWFATAASRVSFLGALQWLASQWASTLLLMLVVGLIFYFVPNAQVRFRDVWVGAIVTGFLLKAALAGFSWYVRDLSRFTLIHGSIAAVVVFLFWVYVNAVIFLYGVEYTAAYTRLLRHRLDSQPAAPPLEE
ncbi:MAG: YihY/virulence factor BrkB family protein [Vicinamibacteraceae bacterium]|nr:YihY/virulence factor BrkB family protein [Vicinamibacteraceae bacterium]